MEVVVGNISPRYSEIILMLILMVIIVIIIIIMIIIIGEGPIDDINESVGQPENKFRIYFTNSKTEFCLSLRYNGNESYLNVNKIEISKSKAFGKINLYYFFRKCI